MLDFIYYPVSFILWCWHWVFGKILGDNNGAAWALAIVFLVFSLRAIMFKPFVKQVRSMRKMQEFAPELKKIQKKYANDRQRQAQEMQKLQREHGVNPLGSCLPMLLQVPVFIGLNHVLRAFAPFRDTNYFFDKAGVDSYVNAKIFGVNLGDAINHVSALAGGSGSGEPGWHWNVAPVAIPLMIVASVATHFTARHSAQRQNPANASAQTAMMQKLTMYVFPAGVLVFGAFFPIGLLIYWLANNGWTLMQQRLVYTKIDREEEAKKAEEKEKRANLGPKPGQKPQAGQKPQPGQKPKPGQKPESKSGQAAKDKTEGDSAKSGQQSGSSTKNGSTPKSGNKAKANSGTGGGAWAKNGGNQRPVTQGKKSQGRKRR